MKTAFTLGLSAAMFVLVGCGGANENTEEDEGTAASELNAGACVAAANAAGGLQSAAGRAAYLKCVKAGVPSGGGAGGGGGSSCQASVSTTNGVGKCTVIKNGTKTETACNAGTCVCNCN
jgi:hypothetical protein